MKLEKLSGLSWIHGLYLINHASLAALKNAPVEQRLLDHLVDGFEGESGCLALLEGEDSGHLRIFAGIGLSPGVMGSRVKVSDGVMGCVIRENSPVLLCGDASSDPRFAKYLPRDLGPVQGSAMCFPLSVLGRIIGALSVSRGTALSPYEQEDLESGTVVVSLISLVIENARLQQEQRSRIAALVESEARFQATFEQAAAGMSMQDIEGRNLEVNNTFCSMLGYTKAEFQLIRYAQITHPDDLARNRELRRSLLAGEVDHYSHEKRYIRKDGAPVWGRASVSLVRDTQGRPKYTVAVIVDISEHKRAEEALRLSNAELFKSNEQLQAAQNQLLQAEKMASIGQLAAGVAHEINNPIGYVNSNLGALENYLRDVFELLAAYETAESALPAGICAELRDLRQKVDLEFVRTDIDSLVNESKEGIMRVTKIVKDLKDFSHVRSEEEWKLADLHEGLESTLNIVRNDLKYKCEIRKEYGVLPEIECIPSELNQVFMNLLVNAGQSIDQRGTITIRTAAADDGVWVEIEDSGGGIAAENIGKIFDPFFTTKPLGSGTGLGLSLSYGIAQKHGGRIEVSSTLGQGSRFRVWLPLRHAPFTAPALAQAEATGA
jgi:two-component system NtrC family sensor kinase